MKLKIIIIIESIAIVLLVLFAFSMKVQRDQVAERARMAEADAIVYRDAAVGSREVAERQEVIAVEQRKIAVVAHERAESLQQQLDKCN